MSKAVLPYDQWDIDPALSRSLLSTLGVLGEQAAAGLVEGGGQLSVVMGTSKPQYRSPALLWFFEGIISAEAEAMQAGGVNLCCSFCQVQAFSLALFWVQPALTRSGGHHYIYLSIPEDSPVTNC